MAEPMQPDPISTNKDDTTASHATGQTTSVAADAIVNATIQRDTSTHRTGDDFVVQMLAALPNFDEPFINIHKETVPAISEKMSSHATHSRTTAERSSNKALLFATFIHIPKQRIPGLILSTFLITTFVAVNFCYFLVDACGTTFTPCSKDKRGFQTMTYTDEDEQEHSFACFVPHVYEKETHFLGLVERYKRPPLIVFLGGIGGEGGDGIDEFKKWFGTHVWEMQRRFPFVVVAPQGHRGFSWAGDKNGATVMRIRDEVEATLGTDNRRVYIVGLSAGGAGVWEMALKAPDRFAAIAPTDTGYRVHRSRFENSNLRPRMMHSAFGVWCTYNIADKQQVIDGVRANEAFFSGIAAPIRFTAYLSSGHESHALTYRDTEFYFWLLDHQLDVSKRVKYDHTQL